MSASYADLLKALTETADQLEDLIEATEGLSGLDDFQKDALANSRVVLRSVARKAIPQVLRVKSGDELITEERIRQIRGEGYTPEHDDAHRGGEIAQAAAALITCNWRHGRVPWPWENGLKDRGEISNLIRAGALIAAEIDRLQRAGYESAKTP